ncbi:MAG: nucleotidyltransferase domain-containing protein, partial [Candidatus Woesearchaeota archaeon]
MSDKKKTDEKIKKIIAKVKLRLRPEKEIFLEVDKTVNKINEVIRKLKIEADCVKGGSIAKNTFLKNDCDIDLFVRFAFKYEDSKLSDMLYEILIEAFSNVKILRVHGSRDYFQFRMNKYDYEIVPVIMLHESNLKDARNITDFSPLHVNWVSGKIKKNPELSDEIRVAKQFCKANNVYGAESYIRGFSGHILDIMIIYYGSFISMVKAFASIDKI